VDGEVHTNKYENFWSLLKRAIRGTYVSVEPFHLFRYLDEHSATTSTAATMPIGSSLPSRHHQQAPHRQGAHRFGVAGNALKKPSRKNAAVPDVPADNPEGTMDRFRHGLRRVLSARKPRTRKNKKPR
jgi:hypothetical protein